MRSVVLPSAAIFVVLKGIEIGAFSMGLVFRDFSLVYTAVIENVSSFNSCLSHYEASLVIGALLKEKLTSSVEIIALPFTSIVSFWLLNFFIRVRKYSFGYGVRIFNGVLGQLLHFLADDGREQLRGHLFGDCFVDFSG